MFNKFRTNRENNTTETNPEDLEKIRKEIAEEIKLEYINKAKEEKEFIEWKKDFIKGIIESDKYKKELQIEKNADRVTGCIDRVIPEYVLKEFFFKSSSDELEERDKYQNLIQSFMIIDRLYVNIIQQKRDLMIVKGLFKAHFNLNSLIVIVLTLIIAAVNLVIGSLTDLLPDTSILIIDVTIGVIGIFVAFFARIRDQKEELTHNLLTVLNECNNFLVLCEKFILKSSIIHIYLDDGFDSIARSEQRQVMIKDLESSLKELNQLDDTVIDKEKNGISLGTIQSIYPNIMKKCEDVINTFSSEESIVLVNGPVYCLDCCECFCKNTYCERNKCNSCFIIFDPSYLKNMLEAKHASQIPIQYYQDNKNIDYDDYMENKPFEERVVELIIKDEDSEKN